MWWHSIAFASIIELPITDSICDTNNNSVHLEFTQYNYSLCANRLRQLIRGEYTTEITELNELSSYNIILLLTNVKYYQWGPDSRPAHTWCYVYSCSVIHLLRILTVLFIGQCEFMLRNIMIWRRTIYVLRTWRKDNISWKI